MTLPLYVALEKIPPSLLEASAGPVRGRLVARSAGSRCPLALPGVVAGSLLTFIPAVGDFVNAELLGNPQSQMIGNVIQAKFLKTIDYPAGAALSFTLMAAILIAVLFYARIAGTEQLYGAKPGVTSGAASRRVPRHPRRPASGGSWAAGCCPFYVLAGGALPRPAGPGHDRVQLQRPGRARQPRHGRASRSTRGSTRWARRAWAMRSWPASSSPSCRPSSRRSIGRAHGPRARPALVPGPERHQPPRVPADVDPGDRARHVPPDAVHRIGPVVVRAARRRLPAGHRRASSSRTSCSTSASSW